MYSVQPSLSTHSISNVSSCGVSFTTSFGSSFTGKVYEIYEETDDYYYLAEMDGKRYEGGMFKWRFKEIDKQEPATVDKTFTVSIAKDKLAAFDKELQALVAKYK